MRIRIGDTIRDPVSKMTTTIKEVHHKGKTFKTSAGFWIGQTRLRKNFKVLPSKESSFDEIYERLK